jgi:sulfide:quinone oxidoreductase
MSTNSERFTALIVGGGVAGLEGALALRDIAGDRVQTTLLSPDPDFVYRPMTVREPFGFSPANRYSLQDITSDIGAELVRGSFKWLEPEGRMVHTDSGASLTYDALLLGLGATIHARFEHALTIDDRRLDEQLHGLIQDVEEGYVRRLVFVAPSPMPWPMPMYELALMTAQRAYDMNIEMSITIATPEQAPLAAFGPPVSEAIEALLESRGILTLTSAHCEVPEPGRVEMRPGERSLHADRVVALPQLLGPSAPGVPKEPADGFIPVNEYCQVRGLDRVYAAGDATDFPIKLGGIAAQQADIAAAAIAALAGVDVQPAPFEPEVHAILLGGPKPLYLSAQLTGGHGSSSELSDSPAWSPPAKIAAKYLGPYLETRDEAGRRAA